MKCIFCGYEITDTDAELCPNCSANLEASKPVVIPTGNNNRIIIAVIAVLVLLIGVGVVAAFCLGIFGSIFDLGDGGKSNKKGNDSDDEHGYVSVIIEDDYNDHDRETGKAETFIDETRPIVETTAPYEETPDSKTEPDIEPDTTPAETTPPETTPAEPVWEGSDRVVIANGGLNMRKGPSRSDAIINCITNGTIVTVERVEDNWAYVTYGGKKGWCSCDYLFVPIEAETSPIYKATVRCSGKIVMFSDGYAEDDEIYTDVYDGTAVQVYEINGSRAYIKYNNIYGWCESKYLERK